MIVIGADCVLTWETEDNHHNSARRIPDSGRGLALVLYCHNDRGSRGCAQYKTISLRRTKCNLDRYSTGRGQN